LVGDSTKNERTKLQEFGPYLRFCVQNKNLRKLRNKVTEATTPSRIAKTDRKRKTFSGSYDGLD